MKRFFTLITLIALSISSVAVQAGNFRLFVDDPTKVDLMLAYSFDYVPNLTPGEWNNVTYGDDDVELVVRSLGGNGCYSVKKDGQSIAQSSSIYKVPLSEGCSIEIITEFPSESYPVEFVFNGCMEDCIVSMEVNYKTVSNFLDPNFKVAAGSRLTLTGNNSDYKFDELKVNGETVDFDLDVTYTTLVTGPLKFEVTAHRYRDFNVSVTIDNPDGVTLTRGNSTTPLRLRTGANTVIFNEKSPYLTIVPNDGFKLSKLICDEKDMLPEYDEWSRDIRVAEGMAIEIGVSELQQITSAIYFDDVESLTPHDLVNASWEDIEFEQGYNIYTLYEGSNSLLFMPSATPAGVYLNGVRQESKYDTWQAYEFTPAENDVVKVFMLAAPETYTVTFESTDNSVCPVFSDMIAPVADVTAPLEVLGNTTVTLKPEAAGENYTVTANGIAVNPSADGTYAIDITGNTTVRYGATTSAITEIGTDEAAPRNVYNLQGILIISDATDADLSLLPSGLYIINGRKHLIRR